MIAYEEFRNLDDMQKADALRELKKVYETNKEMGAAWGVSPLVISNLYKKYVEGIKVGRKPKSDQEAASSIEAQEQASEVKAAAGLKVRKRRSRKHAADESGEGAAVEAVVNAIPEITADMGERDFKLALNSRMSGEDAQKRFAAIANMFLSGRQYKIVLELKEV